MIWLGSRMLIHIYNLLKHLLVFTLIKIPVHISAFIVVPIAVLLLPRKKSYLYTKLPFFLSWYNNGDEYDEMFGIVGPPENQERNKDRGINPEGKLAGILWLLRNPINHFQYRTLGIYTLPHPVHLSVFKVDNYPLIDAYTVGDQQNNSGGVKYIKYHKWYEYYIVIPYQKGPGRCFRARIGWKLGGRDEIKRRARIQWAFAVHPWHGYNGV